MTTPLSPPLLLSPPAQITKFLLEPTGGGLEESTAENVLAAL